MDFLAIIRGMATTLTRKRVFLSSVLQLLAIVAMVLVSAVALLPFWIMLVMSVGELGELLINPLAALWPTTLPTLDNYATVFNTLPMGRFAINSLWIAVVTTLGHVLLAAMAGYAFARCDFKGKTIAFFACLITLMIPPQVNIVPLFFEMSWLGWMDTPLALIVPGLFGGFGIFLCRQWFMGFPKELEEAATLDGCSLWQTFWHIALPTAMPILVTLGLFTFVASWNSFMWPLVTLHSETWQTLPLGLLQLKSQYRDVVDWPVVMAAATISVAPVVALFIAIQRWVMRGLLSGAVKG